MDLERLIEWKKDLVIDLLRTEKAIKDGRAEIAALKALNKEMPARRIQGRIGGHCAHYNFLRDQILEINKKIRAIEQETPR